MSKYSGLWEYVAKADKSPFMMSYLEIEEVAGLPIDHSFLTFKKELLPLGWKVAKISMKNQTVTFERVDE